MSPDDLSRMFDDEEKTSGCGNTINPVVGIEATTTSTTNETTHTNKRTAGRSVGALNYTPQETEGYSM